MSDPHTPDDTIDRVNAQILGAAEDVRRAVASNSDPLALAIQQATAMAMLNAVQLQHADHMIADAAFARVMAVLLRTAPQNPEMKS